jgi:hypothetical protein
MDSYADMNFAALRHVGTDRQIWLNEGLVDRDVIAVHDEAPADTHSTKPQFIREGRLSLEDSVRYHIKLIEYYRKQNGPIPVMYFDQPIIFYPTLKPREEFSQLGRLLSEKVDNFYLGDIPAEEIINDGRTALHFTPMTYRRMVFSALDKGLHKNFPRALDESRVRKEQFLADAETPRWRWIDFVEDIRE